MGLVVCDEAVRMEWWERPNPAVVGSGCALVADCTPPSRANVRGCG